MGCLVLGFLASGLASPIRPDLRQLISQPPAAGQGFAPARAGWNGSESRPATDWGSASLEKFGPEAAAREARESLIVAITPDLRVWVSLALVILLARAVAVAKTRRERHPEEARPESKEDVRQAA